MYFFSYFNDKKKILNSCFYLSYNDFNDDLETKITDFLNNNIHPTFIYIYLPKSLKSSDKLDNIIYNRIPDSIKCIKFCYAKGGITCNEKALTKSNKEYLINEHKQHAFINIFNDNNAIIKADEDTQFITQGGTTTNCFIRVGNLLTNSDEIEVLAIYLIDIIADKEFIYIDSSTILPLVYCSLLHIQNDKSIKNQFITPKIKIFDASKIDSIILDDEFKSIFIISTTINGRLSDNLINTLGISKSIISVIFSFEEKTESLLRYSAVFHDSERKLLNKDFYSNKNPDYVKNNKKFTIPIDNDLFVPISTEVSTILLTKEDSPKFVDDFQIRYGKHSIIECFSQNLNSGGNQRDIFFKVSNLLSSIDSFFSKKLEQQIISQVPNNNTVIIYLDDKESQIIASKFKKSKRKFISSVNFSSFSKELNKDEIYNFYIIASCISNGKKIMNISMKLREFSNANIHYVIGFFRCKNKSIEKQIKSNLKYGKYGFDTYKLSVIENIYLPNESSNNLDWKKELDLIKELLAIDSDLTLNSDIKRYLIARRKVLENGNLTNNLFLDKRYDCEDDNCNAFQLNKNFAFFNSQNWHPDEVSQAQVYFTMLSIMHNYRLTKNIKQSVYNRYLLDPENFIRFNDSIIRATLLRVASIDELNYAISIEHSGKMREIILNILTTLIFEESRDYCILYEFLLSLSISKMTLVKDDLMKIIDEIKKNKNTQEDYLLTMFYQWLEYKFLNIKDKENEVQDANLSF